MEYNEMSQLMDVLYNNITSNQAPGLTEHEKSVFLTKAEEEILKNYFNPKGNKYQEGFDGNQKRQIDFSVLTRRAEIGPVGTTFQSALYDGHDNAVSIQLPTDVWMIVNERVKVKHSNDKVESLTVVPLTFEDYDRLMSKPYKRPLKYQAWRLIINENLNMADIIPGPRDIVEQYVIRYIRRPKPIIVGSLDGLTIHGYCFEGDRYAYGLDLTVQECKGCELDPILHEEIVQRAVELAKAAWTQTGQDNTQAVMTVGQRSE